MNALLARLSPGVAVLAKPVRRIGTRFMVFVGLVGAFGAAGLAFGKTATEYFVCHYFVLDASARLFLLLVNFAFAGIAFHVHQKMRHDADFQRSAGRFVSLSVLFLLFANLAVLSNHLLLTWILIELTTFAMVPLIFVRLRPSAVAGAWKYFLFSTVGLALAMLGLAALSHGLETSGDGNLFADNVSANIASATALWRRLGLALILLGYGTKLGLAPMYAWLPDAYDEAPAPVTAFLASIQFNCALLAVFRIVQAYHSTETELFSAALITMGLVSMVVSAVHIIATDNLKRLIAFASINHAGVIAIGIGVGRRAAYGVILYAVGNTFVKAILFLTASSIKTRFGTRQMKELRGLIKLMPYSAVVFMLGIFALLGFAPFATFMGEVVILQSVLSARHYAVFGLFVFILTIVFIATGRSLFPMIWGEPLHAEGERERFWPLWPKLLFLAGLIVLGIYVPAPVNALFQQVADTVTP